MTRQERIDYIRKAILNDVWAGENSTVEDATINRIVDKWEADCGKPPICYATTRQLLKELDARGRREPHYEILGSELSMGALHMIDKLPGSMLDYRTVDAPAGEQ